MLDWQGEIDKRMTLEDDETRKQMNFNFNIKKVIKYFCPKFWL